MKGGDAAERSVESTRHVNAVDESVTATGATDAKFGCQAAASCTGQAGATSAGSDADDNDDNEQDDRGKDHDVGKLDNDDAAETSACTVDDASQAQGQRGADNSQGISIERLARRG